MKILLVDDDKISCKLLRLALESAGFEVIESRDGMEGLQILRENHPLFIVLDYEMPELNGAQICEIIRKDPDPDIANVPIILLTGHSGEDHEIECLKAGADDFVTKPINTAILKARIDTHLRLHAMRDQLQVQNDELEAARRNHELDLEAARLTQQAIIPQRMPSTEKWSFSSHYNPLIQVGGDIYDWLPLSDGNWVIWIADATGHGASAALLTTLTKLLFRHASSESTSPAAIMNTVNLDFHAIFKGKSFMTAMCLVLQPDTGQVTVSGAGHPPLLIARKNGKIDSIPSFVPPIGLDNQIKMVEKSVELEAGDGFLLYTDGLYGMSNATGNRMSQNELMGLLKAPEKTADEFLSVILEGVTSYAQGMPFPDDMSAIAAVRCE